MLTRCVHVYVTYRFCKGKGNSLVWKLKMVVITWLKKSTFTYVRVSQFERGLPVIRLFKLHAIHTFSHKREPKDSIYFDSSGYGLFLSELLVLWIVNVRYFILNLSVQINVGLSNHLSKQINRIWSPSHYLSKLLTIRINNYRKSLSVGLPT